MDDYCWFIYINDQISGPFTEENIVDMIRFRDIEPETLINYGEVENWRPTAEVDVFAPHFARNKVNNQPPPLPGLPRNSNTVVAETPYEPFEDDFTEIEESSQKYYVVDTEKKICPHCWHQFFLNEVLYMSEHSDLWGHSDVLGKETQARFLPTHFNKNGQALDEKGAVCSQMACPHCHLHIPGTIMDLDSSFFSIVGAPASGKSYFLASMVRAAKKSLSQIFNISFADADPTMNHVINDYETKLFMSHAADRLVALEKTQLAGGDMYDSVILGGRPIGLPKPFIYKIQPYGISDSNAIKPQNLILYDNAGEHFQPGMDDAANPSTQHLAHSDGIMFIFDATLDPRLRPLLEEKVVSRADERIKVQNQEILLAECLARLQKHRVIKGGGKYVKPFIVVLSKFDEWSNLLPFDLRDMNPVISSKDKLSYEFDFYIVKNVSYYIRNLLLEHAPEFVSMVEAACSNVLFVPNSALGCSPELMPDGKMWGVRPVNIKPLWAEIPLLMLMAQASLLPVNSADDIGGDIIEVKDYRIANDMVTFIHPGTLKRCQLPRSYFGCVINDYEREQWFRVPNDAGSESVEPAQDDFWGSL